VSRSTGYRLLSAATTTPIEVVEVETDDLAPDGSIRIILRIPEEDVETAALGLIFAVGVVSFSEARPAGSSEIDYTDEGDEWTLDDMVANLTFPRGHLHFRADYVRGRMMKTTVDVSPNGRIVLEVVNRGASARRWVATLQGKKHLSLVGEAAQTGPFIAPSGDRLEVPEDWKAVHPPAHWKAGRPEMALARSWGGAGGFPPSIRAALERDQSLRDLRISQAQVKHEPVGRGGERAAVADIMLFAEDSLGNDMIIVVEGMFDESFGKPISMWVNEGKTPVLVEKRRRRAREMVLDLCIDPDIPGVDDLAYPLVHRVWSGLRIAIDTLATRAVFLVHGFTELPSKGRGWPEFRQLAGLLVPDRDPIEVGVPYRVEVIEGVELWLLWVHSPNI